jgi:hypothetical protein
VRERVGSKVPDIDGLPEVPQELGLGMFGGKPNIQEVCRKIKGGWLGGRPNSQEVCRGLKAGGRARLYL